MVKVAIIGLIKDVHDINLLLSITHGCFLPGVVDMALSEEDAHFLKTTKCESQDILSAGVAKVLVADSSANSWENTGIWGALLFTYDSSCDQHLFRVFDLASYELRFEYEVYEDLRLQELTDRLMAFEADNFHFGFLFSDSGDAADMRETVEEEAPRAADALQLIVLRGNSTETWNSAGEGELEPNAEKRLKRVARFFGLSSDSLIHSSLEPPGKRRLRDALKDLPILSTDFHIALKDDGTLNVSSIPTPLKQFFKEIGIRKRDIRNPDVAKLIVSALRDANVVSDYDDKDSEQTETTQAHTPSPTQSGHAGRSKGLSPLDTGAPIQGNSNHSFSPSSLTSPKKNSPTCGKQPKRNRKGRSSILFGQANAQDDIVEEKHNETTKDSPSVSNRVARRSMVPAKDEASISRNNKQKQNGLKGALQAAIMSSSRRQNIAPCKEEPKAAKQIKDPGPPRPDFLQDIKKAGDKGGFGLKKVENKNDQNQNVTSDTKVPPKRRKGRVSVVNFADEGQALTVMEKVSL